METYINCSILADFFDNQPLPIPLGEENDNSRWHSFWKYLQQETDLFIDDPTNLTDDQIRFLDQILLRNRNETKWYKKQDLLDSPYKNVLKNKSPHSFYCIDIVDQQEQKRFKLKNGLLIGFLHNYLKEWERFKLIKEKFKSFPVRKGIKGPVFSSWELLDKFLAPFTDVVLVDNYIFSDENLVSSNFERIVNELDKATPVKYNFLIVTFEGDKYKLNGQKIFDQLKVLKTKSQLKCDVGLVIATRKVKEHDRGIFTNYLRIKSGDSFNYFNSNDEIITGTDIDFCSMAEPDKAHAAKVALDSIAKNILLPMKQGFTDTHVFGNTENRLLNLG